MTLTKLAIGVLCIASAAALAASVVVQHQSLARLQDENQGLRQQLDQLARIQAENERLSNMVAVIGNSSSLSEKQVLELARLRAEVGKLRTQGDEMTKLQTENRRIRTELTAPLATRLQEQAMERRDECMSNLTLIQTAKMQWALDNHKLDTDRPRMVDMLPYFQSTGGLPVCPDHGMYILGQVGEKPQCNIPGHSLP